VATLVTLYLFAGCWTSGATTAAAFICRDRYHHPLYVIAAFGIVFWPVIAVAAGRSILAEVRKVER
jgi:hypothetical protein